MCNVIKLLDSVNMSVIESIGTALHLMALVLVELGRSKDILSTDSVGMKRGVENCYFRTENDGKRQEFCNINNKLTPAVSEYFNDRMSDSYETCKTFDLSNFNEHTASIVYTESQGRVGNQLLKYAIMYQLR